MWMPASQAPEHLPVRTKIDGQEGERTLVREGAMWWLPGKVIPAQPRPSHYWQDE